MDNYYSFTPINLALDGTLEQFIDLYHYTRSTYNQILVDHPELYVDQENDRQLINAYAIPILLPEFELLAFRRLRIFTTKFKSIYLLPNDFKYFDFFDRNKLQNYQFNVNLHLEFPGIFKKPATLTTIDDVVVELDVFLDLFRGIVTRAIHAQTCEIDPSYTLTQCRKDVASRIKARMKMRIEECKIPNNIDHPPTNAPLFLYMALNQISCKRNAHDLIPAKYYLRHSDNCHTIVLPVHYCKTCNRYLCGTTSFSLYKEYFGKLIIDTYNLFTEETTTWNTNSESKLHKLGYNVINGKLSSLERKNILITILESNQLSFFQIVATIEQNIRTFDSIPRMQSAVKKWRDDLRFINDYMLNKSQDP